MSKKEEVESFYSVRGQQKHKKYPFFKFYIPWFIVTEDWGKTEPTTTPLLCISNSHTKFGMIHQPWLKKMPVESSELPQKEVFVVKLSIFKANLLPEDETTSKKQRHFGELRFSSFF